MSPWSCTRINYFPLVLGIVMVSGIITTYIIAVVRKDVSPYLPFISETGGYPPEAGIFSIILYLTSTIVLLTIILRYVIVEECNKGVDRSMQVLNRISLAFAILSMAGMIVVASYPMTTVAMAHNIGAFTLFISSTIYGILQTVISYRMYPYYNGLCICRIRLTLIILSLLALITNIIFNAIAMWVWESVTHEHWTGSKTPKDKGFDLLLVSSVAEWAMTFLFVLYFFTFAREFMKVTVHLNVQLLVNHFDEEVVQGSSNIATERTPIML